MRSNSCMPHCGEIIPPLSSKQAPRPREHFPPVGWNHSGVGKIFTKQAVNPRTRLAQNLRALIDMQELSAPRVAELAKVDRKSVNNLLHGRFDPRLSLVEKVANVFGMTTWQILATDFQVKKIDSAQVVRLIDHYSKAPDAGRTAIMQVAQIAAEAEEPAGT